MAPNGSMELAGESLQDCNGDCVCSEVHMFKTPFGWQAIWCKQKAHQPLMARELKAPQIPAAATGPPQAKACVWHEENMLECARDTCDESPLTALIFLQITGTVFPGQPLQTLSGRGGGLSAQTCSRQAKSSGCSFMTAGSAGTTPGDLQVYAQQEQLTNASTSSFAIPIVISTESLN
eukprot:scaffold61127_cov21-Tisochrysis_lutea.AAC.1